MVMIPVVQLKGIKIMSEVGPGEQLSNRLAEAFDEVFGDEGVRADVLLEVLAAWSAALIKVHPSCREYLEEHFNTEFYGRLKTWGF